MNDLTQSQQNPKSIEEWTKVLCEQEMPIFSNTANNIYATLNDTKKGAMELASIILQDPNLTTKLLKVSNSSYYNPSRQKMNTVSRAIVILGAEVIRELTLACSFFESILSEDNKAQANHEIANAIHAAVQAKALAIATNDPSPEEVFIAALLHKIGNIAFWCFSQKQGIQINELIQSGNFSASEAEKKVLGFTLSQLSKSLSKTWRLRGLIEEAIKMPNANNKRVQFVQLGHETRQAIKSGWDSEAMQLCIKKQSMLTGQNGNEIKTHIKQCMASAVAIAKQFGAHDASEFIDSTARTQQPVETEANPALDKKQIQFHISEEITDHISGTINLNMLFEQVLEGIHRGIGMDRTLFMLLGANKQELREKLSLGWQKTSQRDKIQVINNDKPNLFFYTLLTTDCLWANRQQHSGLYDQQLVKTFGRSECFVLPIQTKNKVIGLIYCDRAINHAPLTKDDFNVAKHFANQARIGLTLYRTRSL
jgi:HD-like signal output (HDOD) protein